MKIFGEEYGFMLTVGSSAAVADLCPDGDLTRIGELLNTKYSEMVKFISVFVEEMAKGYDDYHRNMGEEITHKPLTAAMVLALPNDELKSVQDAALKAFRRDSETTVEVEPSKKKENRSRQKSS